ncbi:methyl-accepting chemotaxis protein [Prevotella communis]|uniref:histidine kinase n=1 Tax=Prevotella communis TaxID=2913614 RepID=A0A1H0GIW2_9BACT|nr:methyl-accepting chemotaxis protein [Prevotella communis]SDO06814.1 methyl-accepting chemotaxis protein [Prevotella communis]
MQRPSTFYRKHLSLRLSLRVASAVCLLLMLTLLVMFFYSRKVMKEDALQRASQTLEGAMVRIDNILLSVEETTGNMYYQLRPLLNNPDTIRAYCRMVVETNPYATGCAIALKPGYYADRDTFMVYYHRTGSVSDAPADSLIVSADSFGNIPYTEQAWYKKPMTQNKALWLNPLEGMDTDEEPLESYSVPIPGDDGEPIGVISVDVSISLLSGTIANIKPTPDSYCAVLDKDGSFIVHPTGLHLMQPTSLGLPDETLQQLLQQIQSGKSGYVPFNFYGFDSYIFYKPFKKVDVPMRSKDEMGWTMAVAMSKDSIFGEYNRLYNYAVIIAIGGLLLMLLACWAILFLRLRPLKMLTEKAQHIAEGHYDDPIPHTWGRDEIGSLQRNFIRMRRAVASQIGELEQLTDAIQQRSKELKSAYKQAQKADKMKTAFLHHMSDQMLPPAQVIDKDVEALRQIEGQAKWEETAKLVENIQKNGNTIARVLNHLLNQSEEDIRKEVEHD